jgi:conjugative relaxase-like TrwC/TraI family protein
LEEKAGLTRRGQGGQRIEPAAMVFACFDHYTSRANDPNLHTHLVALNVVVREDGTTGALHNTGLFDHRAEADMIYKVHFALGLMLEMGLQVEEEGHGFRIVGVPKELCDVFSKRRAQILEYLDENGLSGAAAASIAAVATRPAKQHITRENLIAECHRIGRALGWGPCAQKPAGKVTKY